MAAESKASEKKVAGNEAFKRGDYDDAISLYSEAIDLDSSNHVYWANRAAAHLGKDNFEAARDDCVKALEIDPTYAKATIRLAKALSGLGDTSQALEALLKAISLAGQESGAKKNVGLREMRKMAQKFKSQLDSDAGRRAKDRAALSQAMLSENAINELNELEAKAQKASMEVRRVMRQTQEKITDGKRNLLTLKHFEQVPENANVFKSVGRAFFKSTPAGVRSDLKSENVRLNDEVGGLKKKKMYFERIVKDCHSNIGDIVKKAQRA